MPSADQLKALLKAYALGDEAQFHSIAMQIAAGEARIGHGKLAEELRELIDKSRARVPGGPTPIPLARPRGEIADLLTVTYPHIRLHDLVLNSKTRKVLDRVIRGAVAGLVGIEGGVVSGVFNLESSGVEAPDWRPRHDKQYHEA
jgi:hypothetical protein